MLRMVKNKMDLFSYRIESRKHEMKKKNHEKNGKTIGAKDHATKSIYPWNPKESVISVIQNFLEFAPFRVFAIQKRHKK